jgi:small subunit ribosomal protein S9
MTDEPTESNEERAKSEEREPAEKEPRTEPEASEGQAEEEQEEKQPEEGQKEEPEAPGEPAAARQEPERSELPPGAELDPIAIEPEAELDAEERARLEAEAEERARLEAEATAEVVEQQPLAAKPAELTGDARFRATGKRKSSVARVLLTPGSGSIEVNRRRLEEYFPRVYLQSVAKQPLVQSGYEATVDVRVRVHGGGISGQAAAVRHGIARALCEVDPELRRELKRRGMLSRDARVKERRKAGLKKARKRPQFSKR